MSRRRRPRAYAHGSRVPGWDDAADLDKDPAGVPDPATTPVPAELRAEIEAHMANYPDRRSRPRSRRWPPPSATTAGARPRAIEQAACVMRLTPGYLSAVATFYDMLETEPVGDQTVYVCTNISCSLRGADALLARVRDETDGDDPTSTCARFECLGACDIAPMASVDGAYVGPLELDEVPELVDALRAGPASRCPTRSSLRRPCADPRSTLVTDKLLFKDIDEPGLNTLDVYERRGGYEALRTALRDGPRRARVASSKSSGLRGRGGAGFSMGKKASFLPKGDMDKYLVCNADESEPGTFKDRELMQKSPHMLIEGMIIAAYAAGANRAFIYIRGEYAAAGRHPRRRARRGARRPATSASDILGSGFSLSLVVHRGAGAYICGEETGLLDSLEGKRGNPRLKPPFPANQGLYQGPTLINNVETLATVPHIIADGRRGVREARRRGLDRHEARLGLRATCSGPATTRSSSGCRRARSSTTSPAARREGRDVKLLVPGRLELAGA